MKAPGRPSTTMRLPRAASATDILVGASGQASPKPVDSVSVASGMVSPISMVLATCVLMG